MATKKSGGEIGLMGKKSQTILHDYFSVFEQDFTFSTPFSDRHWKIIPLDCQKELDLTFSHDGEFYMSFRDFLKYFGELELCHLSPEFVEANSNDSSKNFEVFSFHGDWTRHGSGGCGNEGLGKLLKARKIK